MIIDYLDDFTNENPNFFPENHGQDQNGQTLTGIDGKDAFQGRPDDWKQRRDSRDKTF